MTSQCLNLTLYFHRLAQVIQIISSLETCPGMVRNEAYLHCSSILAIIFSFNQLKSHKAQLFRMLNICIENFTLNFCACTQNIPLKSQISPGLEVLSMPLSLNSLLIPLMIFKSITTIPLFHLISHYISLSYRQYPCLTDRNRDLEE